jgi:hypothetical protein
MERLEFCHHHRMRLSLLALALAPLFVVGCGSDDGNGTGIPEVDCSEPVPRFAEVLAFPRTCNSCHSVAISDDDPRRMAPPGMNFDLYSSAVEYAEEAAITVNEGTMPVTGGIRTSDKEDLYLWALCGTPQ